LFLSVFSYISLREKRDDLGEPMADIDIMESWDALGGVWPAGRGRFSSPSTLP